MTDFPAPIEPIPNKSKDFLASPKRPFNPMTSSALLWHCHEMLTIFVNDENQALLLFSKSNTVLHQFISKVKMI
jgi:hypothetical protein